MSRAANNMKQIKQSVNNSDASLRLKNDSAYQVPEEVYEIARLLASIVVEKHFDEIKET